MPSRRAIVFVDPASPTVRIHEREPGSDVWRSNRVEGLDQTIDLPYIGVRLPLDDEG